MDKKSKIKCNVESCKHQDSDKCECKLDGIQVSCVCDNDDCTCSVDTVCDSFDTDIEDSE